MKGFVDFVREQGVVGLAVGFILGGAVAKVVASLVADIINPIIGAFLGNVALSENEAIIAGVAIKWGSFLTTLIDFGVIAAVLYFGVKWLGLDKLDKASEG